MQKQNECRQSRVSRIRVGRPWLRTRIDALPKHNRDERYILMNVVDRSSVHYVWQRRTNDLDVEFSFYAMDREMSIIEIVEQ
jgi:hypothetical protein